MKKLKLQFLLFFTILLLTGCKDEIALLDNQAQQASIVGDWEMIAYEGTGTATVRVIGQNTTISTTSVGKDFDFTLSFTDVPNSVKPTGGFKLDVTTAIAGIPTTQTIPANTENFEGQWSLVKQRLIITPSNTTITFDDLTTVTELTDTTLKLNIKVDTEEDIQGVTADVSNDINVEFKRK